MLTVVHMSVIRTYASNMLMSSVNFGPAVMGLVVLAPVPLILAACSCPQKVCMRMCNARLAQGQDYDVDIN